MNTDTKVLDLTTDPKVGELCVRWLDCYGYGAAYESGERRAYADAISIILEQPYARVRDALFMLANERGL